MVSIPNIYKSRHMKYFIIVPVALMLVSIALSTRITLDSTLSGGVSIVLQTSANTTAQQISSVLSSKLGILNPSVAKAPGGIQITIPLNKSLSYAYSNLTSFDQYQANYSKALVNSTTLGVRLQNNETNSTILAMLAASNKQINISMYAMSASLNAELAAVRPLAPGLTYQKGNVNNMSSVAQGAYQDALSGYTKKVMSALSSAVSFSSYSYEQVSPQIGRFFLNQLLDVVIVAFVIISIVVFFIFRSPAPAFAVVFGAANDMVIALGAMALFGIPLGITSIGGLLMLLGYSIDTDVLTAVRILKRHEGSPEDRAFASMKTGFTMTSTAIVSFGVLFAISLFEYVPTYYEIAGVVLFGLIGDLATTWLGNASLVLMYKKRKDKIK